MSKILSPVGRGSYCNLDKPKAIGEDPTKPPRYGMQLLLPKNRASTNKFINDIKAAAKAALKEKLGREYPLESCKHWPIRDGDEPDDDGETRPEAEGCWVVTLHNVRKPGLLVQDGEGRREAEVGECYSGAFYLVSLKPYAWKHKTGGTGISLSLSGVLKARDGDALGDSFSESEFDAAEIADDEDAAPAKPAKGKRRNTDEPPF